MRIAATLLFVPLLLAACTFSIDVAPATPSPTPNPRSVLETPPSPTVTPRGVLRIRGLPTPTPGSAQPTPTLPPTQQPAPVAATDLFFAYRGNEVGADAKYKGKRIAVRGTVGLVDGHDVKLIGGAMGATGITQGFISEAVVCKVPKAKESSIIDLLPGDNVVVVGTVKGKGFTDIELADCEVAS